MSEERIRIDKWLWFARQTRSRSLASRLVSGGHVRVNRERITAASRLVGPGDVLTVNLPRAVRVLKILQCGTRRGPYPEACQLYEDLAPPAGMDTESPDQLRAGPRPPSRERKEARSMAGKPG